MKLHLFNRKQITILIAHRLSTIMHADRIHVLERGKIVESGEHNQLLRDKGLYYAMWRQQIGESFEKTEVNGCCSVLNQSAHIIRPIIDELNVFSFSL